MSMRVLYAYLFKENAEFKDIQEARQYINDLREKFIKWVPTDMIKWTTIMKLSRAEQMEKLEKDTQDPEIGGVWDYQLQCVMFAREVDGVNYIALQFFPSRPVVKFLKENVNLREFWYENQTDEGFDLPDWEFRRTFWNTVYHKYWTSSQAGFACDIYNGTEWNTTSSIMSELAVLADKQKEKKEKKD